MNNALTVEDYIEIVAQLRNRRNTLLTEMENLVELINENPQLNASKFEFRRGELKYEMDLCKDLISKIEVQIVTMQILRSVQ